jgi:hypothetical protein
MQQNLVGLERAKLNCHGAASGDDRTIDVLIAACSDAITKWCRRDFLLRSYDELYSGSGDRRLLLREYPVVSVEAVRYRPVTVFKVTNTNPANVQARVTVTATGLTLYRANAGALTTDTSCTFAANATLTALAAAVNALGNGWSAQVVGDATNYGSWPAADLYVPPSYGGGTYSQGALQCVAGSFAELKMHTYELQGFQWDPRGWLLRAIPYTDPELLHPEDLVWPVGVNNFRVQYTAGYATTPEAVQEACAEWVAELWFLAQRDPALRTLSTAPSGGTAQSQVWGGGAAPGLDPPPNVQRLLAPYRRLTVATDQG